MTSSNKVPPGIAVLAALAATVPSGPAAAASPDRPIVVELFQSQGCSSCPPANAMFHRLADRADLLPLNFGVTYWDRLGWKDKFAHPAHTERQWDNARSGKRHNDATPQFIINLPAYRDANERSAVLIQQGSGGRIIAANKL